MKPIRSFVTRRILTAASCCVAASPAWAQEAPASTSAPAALPLREVVLFSSGVGYFGRAGEVGGAGGEATVPLSFRTSQVNDVLKSLVIFDATGGVRPVTFATKDSAARTLGQSGVSLGSEASLGELLRQFQGAQVRIDAKGEAYAFEGRIVSVQDKAVTDAQNRVTQVEILNVLTADGLRALNLDAVNQVELLDKELNRQLQENLSVAATRTDDSKRTVQLRFAGGARRGVRAGYLLESPVWKTSYRLVLDSPKDAKAKAEPAFLQGWGLVENTTDDDWRDVKLSLVSGRPISFIQDLYQPLYIPRPVVEPQVLGSPTPQLYGETVTLPEPDAVADEETNAPAAPAVSVPMEQKARSSRMESRGGFGSGGIGGNFAPGAFARGPIGVAPIAEADDSLRKDMARSLAQTAAQAQGGERGELFEYAISQPVTLPKNQAAMVPILSQSIGGERVSIYNPAASPLVLSGFRLKNSTKLRLAGGPLTVFQGGAYAGDAQIGTLAPSEERLISYAVDGDLVPAVAPGPERSQTLKLVAKAGVLTVTRKLTRSRTYTFRNKGEAAKQVLVQQPIEEGFEVTLPKGAVEKTADEHRFTVAVPAGKSVELKVETQRPLSQTVALLNLNLDALISYARDGAASPAMQKALQELVAKRRALAELQAKRAALTAELASVDAEQNRIRQNMAQLDRNSALYKQYVEKLTAQEKQVEDTKASARALDAQIAAAQKVLQDATDTLTLE